MLDKQENDNQRWYDRQYNLNGTERADAQAAINRMRQMYEQNMRDTAGMSAVSGGTLESQIASKQAANDALAQTIAAIDQNNEAQKNAIDQQNQATKANITAQRIGNENARQQAIAQAGAGIDNAINTVAKGFLPSK